MDLTRPATSVDVMHYHLPLYQIRNQLTTCQLQDLMQKQSQLMRLETPKLGRNRKKEKTHKQHKDQIRASTYQSSVTVRAPSAAHLCVAPGTQRVYSHSTLVVTTNSSSVYKCQVLINTLSTSIIKWRNWPMT